MKFTVPIGPQHPALKEPISLRMTVEGEVIKGVEPRSQVNIVFTGPFQNTPLNRLQLQTMSEMLGGNLHQTLREDMGGTYGVNVDPKFSKFPTSEYQITVDFSCDPARVDALELGDQVAEVNAAPGRLDLEDLLGGLDEAGGVGMRADAADALGEVDVLQVGLFFGQLLQPAMVVAQPEVGVPDDLPLDGHAEADRLL